MTRRKSNTKQKQGDLPFRSHGGARKGAGRKPRNGKAGVGHRPRAAFPARHPLHVTTQLRTGLPRLRRKAEHDALRGAFTKGRDRFGFRLVHYVVLNDHLHFVCEASDRTALRRGIQGLLIRIARALNRLWRRKGKVFADRYHHRELTSPRSVRNVLVYVFGNARKHAATNGVLAADAPALDAFSSAPWFDGFREIVRVRGIEFVVQPTATARTWLLGAGWRRHGLLSVHEVPRTG